MVLALSLVPHAIALARAATSGWEGSGDQAMMLMRMHDVGTEHTPLLGPYSRFGWDHPGPLLFWVGAPGLRLVGPVGVMVTVALLNAAAAVGTVAAARKVAGAWFALTVATAMTVLVHAHGATTLVDPWNPWVTVLPLACYLVSVAAAVVSRAPWPLYVAVATGSFAAQSHLGNAPVVGVAALAGAAWWWRTRRSIPAATGPLRRRHAILAAVLLVALWSGPIIDQVTRSPGNLSTLLTFARTPTEEPEPLAEALGAAARELGWWPAWIGVDEGLWPVRPAPAITLAVLPAILVAFLTPAIRRRLPSVADRPHLAAYALVLYCGAVFAVTRTTGGLIAYVLRWTWPVAMLAFAVAALPFLSIAVRRPGRRGALARRVVAVGAVTVALVASASATRDALRDPVLPSPPTDETTRALAHDLREVLPVGAYGLQWHDARSFSAVSIGTGGSLVRHGYWIDFPEDHADRVGAFRATGRTDLPVLMIVGQTPRELWQPPGGARLVLAWDHLTPAQRARADRLEHEVRAATGLARSELVYVDDAGARRRLVALGADPADVEELHRLEADREGYEVWLAPAGTPRNQPLGT
jgi:hypothetical protein